MSLTKEGITIELSTNYADIGFKDNILYIIVKPDHSGTLEEMKEHTSAVFNHFAEKIPVCSIVINNVKIRQTSKEYRDYVAGPAVKKLFTAMAIVMENNPMTKIAGNLFLKFSRPSYPTKIFTSVEDAKDWLKQYQ